MHLEQEVGSSGSCVLQNSRDHIPQYTAVYMANRRPPRYLFAGGPARQVSAGHHPEAGSS